MVSYTDVGAVIVTRGNVEEDLQTIIKSIPFKTYIWDNSVQEDLGVYGRYKMIERIDKPIIYVQDDDCILAEESFDELLAAYEPKKLVCNMPPEFRENYTDSCLVGFGAIFDRDLPRTALERYGHPEVERDDCDIVVTTLNDKKFVNVGYRNLPYAYDDDRMWRQSDHVSRRAKTLDDLRQFIRANELKFTTET